MSFFAAIGSGISKAVDCIAEKNHRAALINRLRVVIKNERETSARAYVALGKYYFDHLRDPQNEETEHLCRAIEQSGDRMKRAFEKLNAVAEPSPSCNACEDCAEDCCACPQYEEEQTNSEEKETDSDFPIPPIPSPEAENAADELRAQRAAKKAEAAAEAILSQAPQEPDELDNLDNAPKTVPFQFVPLKDDGESADDEP